MYGYRKKSRRMSSTRRAYIAGLKKGKRIASRRRRW